jgi:hypothetical protein
MNNIGGNILKMFNALEANRNVVVRVIKNILDIFVDFSSDTSSVVTKIIVIIVFGFLIYDVLLIIFTLISKIILVLKKIGEWLDL